MGVARTYSGMRVREERYEASFFFGYHLFFRTLFWTGYAGCN